MNKSILRKEQLAWRRALSEAEVVQKSKAIASHVLDKVAFRDKTVHIFLPIEKHREIHTWSIIEEIKGQCNLVTSKSNFRDFTMSHYRFDETTKIKEGPFGIPEPETGDLVEADMLDIVFVPLVAFDTQGHRIGYGKGFYDRFLANCRSDCLKIGLSLFEAQETFPDPNEFDIELDMCITPEKIYAFKTVSKPNSTGLNDKKYQGFAHILIIAFVPGILASIFLFQNYFVTAVLVLLLIASIVIAQKSANKK